MVEKFRQLYGSSFQPELIEEIEKAATLKTLPQKAQLIKIGDYIRSMPFVLNGSIKTLRHDKEGRELLLYFINPGETCAMTLSCCLGHSRSKIKAVAETDVEMLVVPIQKMEAWASHYKTWRNFVFKSYHDQLMRALETIDDIAFSKLDTRLLEAAADLGARPFAAFRHVTLPLSMPGVIAGSMLVFIPAVGEYVIPEMLGGANTLMMGRVMWNEFFNNADWPMAAAVTCVMVLLLIVPLVFFQYNQVRNLDKDKERS